MTASYSFKILLFQEHIYIVYIFQSKILPWILLVYTFYSKKRISIFYQSIKLLTQ